MVRSGRNLQTFWMNVLFLPSSLKMKELHSSKMSASSNKHILQMVNFTVTAKSTPNPVWGTWLLMAESAALKHIQITCEARSSLSLDSWLRYVDTVSTLGLRPLLVLLESASNTESLTPLCFIVVPVVFGTAATKTRGAGIGAGGTPPLLALLVLLLPLLPEETHKIIHIYISYLTTFKLKKPSIFIFISYIFTTTIISVVQCLPVQINILIII